MKWPPWWVWLILGIAFVLQVWLVGFRLGWMVGLGVLVVFGGLGVFILWSTWGPKDPNFPSAAMLLLLVASVAGAALAGGLEADRDLLPQAMIQIGTAMIAGLVVGIVIVVLNRREP